MSILTPRSNRYDRNLFINGNFDFFRYGTAGNLGYVADRFRTSGSGNGQGTAALLQSKNTDVPFGGGNSMQLECIGLASPDPTDSLGFVSIMEGADIEEYLGQEVTFGAHFKANHTGTYGVGFNVGAGEFSYVSALTIDTADVWQFHTFTVTLPSSVAAPLDNTNGFALVIELMESSAFSTSTLDQIISGNKRGIAGQKNLFDNIGNTLKVAKVQLLKGSGISPTEFVRRGFDKAEELQKCKRYMRKTYSEEVTPGTITSSGRYSHAHFETNSNVLDSVTHHFGESMRAAPQMTAYSYNTGAANQCLYVTAASSSSVHPVNFYEETEKGFSYGATGTVGGTRGNAALMLFHWVARAEL